MYTEKRLMQLTDHPGAADLPIVIAIAETALSKNWKTISVSWPKLITALSEPKITGETFDEYRRANKKIQRAKKDAAGAFVGGALKGPLRRIANLTDRDLLTLDFDGPDGEGMSISFGELLDTYQKKFNNEAVFYSTHSHQATKPRIRLVLPMSRTLKQEEYEPVVRMVADDLGIEEVDPASFSPIQCMFFPTASTGAEYRFFHQPGPLLDPDEILNRYEDPQDKAEWPGKAAREASEALPLDWDGTVAEGSQAAAIGHREATEAVKEWTARECQKLQDYGNFLSALFVIVKGVQHGEITRETGQECAVLLAGNRDEWKHDNVVKFNKELDNPDIRTDYTFRQKFMWQPGSDPVDDFEFIEGSAIAKQFKRNSITASELRKTEFPPLTYFVDDLITPGLTVLAAPPKSGKSWLILSMLMSISSGAPFLGKKTEQAPSFYLALEDSERRIAGRMKKIDPVHEYPFLEIQTEAVPMISIPDRHGNQKSILTWENDFLKFLDEYHKLGFRVFVVDVFQKIRPGVTNPNQYEGDYKEVSPLQKWAKEKDSALILIHHFKKGSQGFDPVERVGGSTGITGAADTIITIEKEMRDSAISKFMVTGRDVSMQTFDATFTDGKWAISDLAETTRKVQELERQEYEKNPLVRTIKHLLTQENEVKITAEGLQKEMNELCGWDALGQNVNKTAISKLSLQLLTNDKITYEYSRSGQRWHIFQHKDRMIFPGYEQTELDLPDEIE